MQHLGTHTHTHTHEHTQVKAKVIRKYVDHMITLAKDGSLHARRQALAFIYDKDLVRSLFDAAPERYGERAGGYTRIKADAKVRSSLHGGGALAAWRAAAKRLPWRVIRMHTACCARERRSTREATGQRSYRPAAFMFAGPPRRRH